MRFLLKNTHPLWKRVWKRGLPGAATLCCMLLLGTGLTWAQDYDGPLPPVADVPYLLHASNLLETEATEARVKDEKKNEVTYELEGSNSPVRTPLAEPIFLILVDNIRPETIEMYRFEVKRDTRELKIKDDPGRNDAVPLHLSVTRIEGNLYRIEAAETLENGEYSLSPTSGNDVFAFQIY